MFIDRVVITFIAGRGGHGCLSFRREKFIPRGGPDGGDGGKGGDIVLVSQKGFESLLTFKTRRIIKAENGDHGKGAKRTGKNGPDICLFVPPGTMIKTFPEEKLLFDFDRPEMEFIVAKGGRGGRGNTRFKSSVNQAPRRVEKGENGETIKVILELKLIAFAGLVGLPNSGKSTLISKLSAARPKIADYPFTTLTPHLGVVYNGYQSLVMADIPGIISGAHRGEGMGLEFLRHIERTRLLIYLVDVSPHAEKQPLQALQILQDELRQYQPALLQKKSLVVANKIDLLEGERQPLQELESFCRQRHTPFLKISALKETHLPALRKRLFEFYAAS